MDKFNNYLFKVICCLILLLLPAFINLGQAVAAKTADVNVVNTPGVSVVNTPDVNVVNTPLPVREVANPVSQPFQAFVPFSMSDGASGATITFLTVPTGKRLVIEYATIIGETSLGKMGAWITTTVSLTDVQHYFVLTEQGPLFGTPSFTASQPMRVYADPATNVFGSVVRSNTNGSAGGNMSISGYLVDIIP